MIEDFLKIYTLNESSSDSEECDESILDKSFFWLKTHGYWSIDFETKNGYCFSMYSNDMDPSKWFGQLSEKSGGDGLNHSIYNIHSKSNYSDIGSYDSHDCVTTPREVFEKTPYNGKIVSVKANKPDIDISEAVEYGVIVSLKKKLCHLPYKEEEMYRKEINKVLESYGKKDGYYTINPEVGDNWEYIDNIVAEVVKNIKAKKKAAAAKRAARE